jgi:pimeloyl-ACP methyl ester carboxylesterase
MTTAQTSAVHFQVRRADGESHTLIGIYYLAATKKPAPVALLLHGIPGSEKNHDLAHALRAAGWHALVLHFSGCWGSGGDYDLTEQMRDARAALDYLKSDDAPRPAGDTLAVVGYSLGSRAALLTALDDDRVTHIISVGGFSDFTEMVIGRNFFQPILPLLRGATVDNLVAAWRSLGTGVQPIDAVAALVPRPILLVHGTADEVVPFSHADALAYNNDHVQKHLIAGANHGFSDHRAELIKAVLDFLI